MTRYLRQILFLGVATVAACGVHQSSDDTTSDEATSAADVLSTDAAPPPGMHRLHLAFAGGGVGQVFVFDGSTQVATCSKTCNVNVGDGDDVFLSSFAPSQFGGWTGACETTEGSCEFTALTNSSVTVTFTRDDREVATILPDHEVRGVAFAASGALIVATSAGVEKYNLDGKLVWTTAVDGGTYGVVVDAGGRIFAASASSVIALSGAGAQLWSAAADVDLPAPGALSIQSPVQASADGSVVAVRTTTGVAVFRRNGAPRFAVTDGLPDGMAVAPDGTVAFGATSDDLPDQLTLRRFSSTGSELTSLSPIPGDRTASLAFDAAGDLGSATSAFSDLTLGFTHADLSPGWQTSIETDDSTIPQGITFDSGGDLIATYHTFFSPDASGLYVNQYSAAGALEWTLFKAPADPFSGGEWIPSSIAADHSNRIAIGGSANFTPWIAVYQM